MAENRLSGDDTDSAQNWDSCWGVLEGLAGRNFPTAELRARAAAAVNSCRVLTEGRGIEQIEDRVRAAYRLAIHQRTASTDNHLDRLMLVMGGALSVLRRVPREVTR